MESDQRILDLLDRMLMEYIESMEHIYQHSILGNSQPTTNRGANEEEEMEMDQAHPEARQRIDCEAGS